MRRVAFCHDASRRDFDSILLCDIMYLASKLGLNPAINKPVSQHSKWNIGENRNYILTYREQRNATHEKSNRVGQDLRDHCSYPLHMNWSVWAKLESNGALPANNRVLKFRYRAVVAYYGSRSHVEALWWNFFLTHLFVKQLLLKDSFKWRWTLAASWWAGGSGLCPTHRLDIWG